MIALTHAHLVGLVLGGPFVLGLLVLAFLIGRDVVRYRRWLRVMARREADSRRPETLSPNHHHHEN